MALKEYRFLKIASLILGLTCLVLACRAEDLAARDGFSELTKGLQARLVFGEERMVNGTNFPEVYLELHNSSGRNPIVFDFIADKHLCLDLQSGEGKSVPMAVYYNVSSIESRNCHVSIPLGGTLKFPLTWDGFGIPRDGGTYISFEGDERWLIPATDDTEYFLSGTLEVLRPSSQVKYVDVWYGTIEIPPVKLPTKAFQ